MLLEVPDSDMPWLLLVLQYVSLRLPGLWPLMSPLTLLANGGLVFMTFVVLPPVIVGNNTVASQGLRSLGPNPRL